MKNLLTAIEMIKGTEWEHVLQPELKETKTWFEESEKIYQKIEGCHG